MAKQKKLPEVDQQGMLAVNLVGALSHIASGFNEGQILTEKEKQQILKKLKEINAELLEMLSTFEDRFRQNRSIQRRLRLGREILG